MGEISSTHIYIQNSEIFDSEGKIKIEIIPSEVIGTKIIIGPTPPENPQENDIWIDTSE